MTFDNGHTRRGVLAGSAAAIGVSLARPARAASGDAIDSLLRAPGGAAELHRSVSARLGPGALALAQRTRAWAALAPPQAERAIQRGRDALKGMLVLPDTGGKPYFIGNPVGWATGPKGALDYFTILHRMEHWQSMLTAWMLTGEAAFPNKVVAELDHWIANCPPPPLDDKQVFTTIVPWRALEVGIRMSDSWASVLKTLAGTPFLPADRLARLATTVHMHCRILAEISPKLWPNANHNHYLFEMTGLLAAATLYPEFKAAAEWKAQAWRELERCAEAQLTRDG